MNGTEGYTGELPPQRFNLARHCLAKGAGHTPDKVALILVPDAAGNGTRSVTYGEIEDRVLRIAAGLRDRGIPAGARLFMRMGNSIDFALMFFAANAAGLVPIPASAMLVEREVETIIADSGAAAIVTDHTLALPPLADTIDVIGPDDIATLKRSAPGDYADTHKEDPAYLIYTSGTSGRPKGVLHAQRAIWGRRPMYDGWYGISADDVMLHTGAFNWTYTLGTGLSDPWTVGATALLYTGPKDITVWPELVRRHDATIMASVPTLYRQLLKYCNLAPDGLDPLRHVLCAGEVLSKALHEQWVTATGLSIFEALGMSEMSTYISSSPTVPSLPGSPGKPQAGRHIVILPAECDSTEPLPPGETGLIAVHRSDPGLMLHYWNRPEDDRKVTRGDWFIGGDLAHLDEAGYIHFHGRNDDVMNAFGYRVSPQEVENVLATHPAVADVGVTEQPVKDDVSVIAAFVVLKEHPEFIADDLLLHAAERLAYYKVPREFHFVDALPRTGNGKVMRRRLPSLIEDRT